MGGTDAFVEHRELLFSIVYGMLGTVADTEDVLQETWLSWAPRDNVENPRAYLVRIAVNHALRRREKTSRETYPGQWLPEPLVGDTADEVVRGEEFSMAVLVVLETLTSAERAVFVLHEVFGYAHPEIAVILGRSPAAVRQLAHRAREHVEARRPRFTVDPRTRQEVTERFMAAALGGDLENLLEILAPDVTLWTDGGGKGPATSLEPVHGKDRVARLLVTVAKNVPSTTDLRFRRVHGDPAVLLFADDAPFAVLVLEVHGDRVGRLYSITNPDKLGHLG
ncbi:RNA polymerase subunit sigma-24 [Saccharothrix sp. ALI-22-I]|uniref:RNA polymerase sigma factor SigJ n=1 Tax=Saccharothrix sp. ALI-22-I TaxID=1933778 RepID=UPI00097C6953|nr:RNA polymerase sigma factor SigJ [Saccharothrix sp. ALI-22-I]ONI80403.1 RNA polymerase subunit sigma-24 [Saccharothrix sp. ALI-22-I]